MSNLDASKLNLILIVDRNVATLSDTELTGQYNGLVNLLCVSAEPNFSSAKGAEQMEILKSTKPFQGNYSPRKSQIRAQHKRGKPKVLEAVKAGSTAYGIATTLYSGGLCLTGVLPACPVAVLSAVFTGADLTERYGNVKRNAKMLQRTSTLATEALVIEPANKFIDYNSFTLLDDLDGDLIFPKGGGDIDFLTTISTEFGSEFNTELINSIKAEIQMQGELTISEVNSLFENYLQGSLAAQKKLLKQQIKAQKNENLATQKAVSEKAMLLNAMNNLVGTLLGKYFEPKKAQILTQITGVGIQYMMYGAMGPMGWGAVALNLATTLLSGTQNEKGSFQQAMMSALDNLRKQLEWISKAISEVYDLQLKTLNTLQTILAEIHDLKIALSEGIAKIESEVSLVYVTQMEDDHQEFVNLAENLNADLENGLINNSQSVSQEMIYDMLSRLVGLHVRLDDNGFTRYSGKGKTLDSRHLLKTLYPSLYRYNISLYDCIGIVGALSNFDWKSNLGTNGPPIAHPVEIHGLASNFLYWGVLADLPKSDLIHFAIQLKKSIDSSRKRLNNYASLDMIHTRAHEFIDASFQWVDEFCEEATEVEEIVLGGLKIDDLQLMEIDQQVETGPINGVEFHNHLGSPYIIRWLTAHGLMGMLREVSRTDQRFAGGSAPFTVVTFNPLGRVVATQNIKVEIDQLALNVKEGIILKNLSFTYTRRLFVWKVTSGHAYIIRETSVRDNAKEMFFKTIREALAGQYNLDLEDGLLSDLPFGDTLEKSLESEDTPQLAIVFHESEREQTLRYLWKQHYRRLLIEIVSEAVKRMRKRVPGFDGASVSLLYLSKLNKVISGEEFLSFSIVEDSDAAITRMVIEEYLITWATEGFEHALPPSFYHEWQKPDGSWEDPLISKQYEHTGKLHGPGDLGYFKYRFWKELFYHIALYARRCVNGCVKLRDQDADPYLGEALNRLNWFTDTFVELED